MIALTSCSPSYPNRPSPPAYCDLPPGPLLRHLLTLNASSSVLASTVCKVGGTAALLICCVASDPGPPRTSSHSTSTDSEYMTVSERTAARPLQVAKLRCISTVARRTLNVELQTHRVWRPVSGSRHDLAPAPAHRYTYSPPQDASFAPAATANAPAPAPERPPSPGGREGPRVCTPICRGCAQRSAAD